MKRIFLLPAVLAISVIPASAQPSEGGEDMYRGLPVTGSSELMVVSATRIPTPVSQVASSVTVVRLA